MLLVLLNTTNANAYMCTKTQNDLLFTHMKFIKKKINES